MLGDNDHTPFSNTSLKYVNSINGLFGNSLFATTESDGIWVESKNTNGKYHLAGEWFNEVKMLNHTPADKLHLIDFKLELFYNDLIFKNIYPHWFLLSELSQFYPDEPCTLLELLKVMTDTSFLDKKVNKLHELITKMDEEYQKYANSDELFASIKASAISNANYQAQLCLSGIVDHPTTSLSNLIYGEKEYTKWFSLYIQSISTRLKRDTRLAQTNIAIDPKNLRIWMGQFSLMIGGYPATLVDFLSEATPNKIKKHPICGDADQ